MANVPIERFSKELLRQIETDINTLTGQLAVFVDRRVIEKKFAEGFPRNKLQPTTIKIKGNNQVGVDTGKLKKRAMDFTAWSLFKYSVGKRGRLMLKSKKGLTPYSHLVQTIIGGEVDFLSWDGEDRTNIQNFIGQFFNTKGYQGGGPVSFIETTENIKTEDKYKKARKGRFGV